MSRRPYVRVLVKLLVAATPLLLTWLFVWLVTEDYLGFGGGEKDIVLAVPLLLWSLIFLLCYLVLWWRRATLGRMIAISCGLATGVVAVAWVIFFGVSWMKFR